jgi:hypothetical protein
MSFSDQEIVAPTVSVCTGEVQRFFNDGWAMGFEEGHKNLKGKIYLKYENKNGSSYTTVFVWLCFMDFILQLFTNRTKNTDIPCYLRFHRNAISYFFQLWGYINCHDVMYKQFKDRWVLHHLLLTSTCPSTKSLFTFAGYAASETAFNFVLSVT